MKPIFVVGAGPAGLSAAIHAAALGRRVVVFEKNGQCGTKLLATGGGHANLGNLLPMGLWPARFGKRGRFIVPALATLPTDAYRKWLASLGISTESTNGFHLYPESGSARQVRDALAAGAQRLGVEFQLARRVQGLLFKPDSSAPCAVVEGQELECSALILACGGRSLPASGSNGDGYALAKQAGHEICRPVPALVGLRAADWDQTLAGLVLPNAGVRFKSKGQAGLFDCRELLLTHAGVSGPAVLDISGSVAESLAKGDGSAAELEIAWVADQGKEEWQEELAFWRDERGNRQVESLTGEHVPRRLAKHLCGKAGLEPGANAASLKTGQRDRLVELLSAYKLRIVDTEGWDKAIVTRGGVDVKRVDTKTLESRLVPRLYFAGEMLDIDGPCGGYNLHWAFASGALAGLSAARKTP